MIVATDIVVRGKATDRLAGVSVHVAPGEVVAVIGPNGSGKSTLLQVLCGEIASDSGEVRMEGILVPSWTPRRAAQRRAGLMQDIPSEIPLTTRAVVGLGRVPFEPSSRDTTIVADALAAAGVSHLAERAYSTLSGGERQRTQWARVLAQIWDPPSIGARYLLLDEPTANLDVSHQHILLSLARSWTRTGVGVFVVLHDMHLCGRYADRVIVLRKGQIVGEGVPTSVLCPNVIEPAFGVRTAHAHDATGNTFLVALGALPQSERAPT